MPRSIFVRYGVAAGSVGFIVLVKGPLESWVGSGPPLILFIPALTFSAWFGGIGPGLLTTVVSVLSCNYLYFPPIGSFLVESGYDRPLQLIVFLVEGLLTSVLMQQLVDARRQSEAGAREAEQYHVTLERAEQAVRRERDFAQSLIAAAQAIVLVLDREGQILRSNPFFEQMTGHDPAKVRGPGWFAAFVPSEDQAEARTAFASALAKPEGSQVIHRIRLRGADACAMSSGRIGRSPAPPAKSSPSATTLPS